MAALETNSNPLLSVVAGGFVDAATPAVASVSDLGTSQALPESRPSSLGVVDTSLRASPEPLDDAVKMASAQKILPVGNAHHRIPQPVAQPDLIAMQAAEFQAALSLESDRIANERGSLGRAALDLALHPEVFATALAEAERAFSSAAESCSELRQDLEAARMDFSSPLTVHEELEIRALIHASQLQSLRLGARVLALNSAKVAATELSRPTVVSAGVPTEMAPIEAVPVADAQSESDASKTLLATPARSESNHVDSHPTSVECDQNASQPIQNTESEASPSQIVLSSTATSPGCVAVKSIHATSKPSNSAEPADCSINRVHSQFEAKRQSLRVSTAYMIEAERAKRVADRMFQQQALQRQQDSERIQTREESLRIDRELHDKRASEKKARIVEDFARLQASRQQNLRGDDVGDSHGSRPPTRSVAVIRDQDLLGALPSQESSSDAIQVDIIDIDSDADVAPSASRIFDNKSLNMSQFDADLHPLPSFTSRFVAPQVPKRHQRFQLEAARLQREASEGSHDLHSHENDAAPVSPFETSSEPASEDSFAVSEGREGDAAGIHASSALAEIPSIPAALPIAADPILISNSESKANSKSSCRVS